MVGIIALLMAFGIGVGICFVLRILEGAVLATLWGWFLVPLGLPVISIPVAVGLSVIVNLVTPSPPKTDKGKEWKQLGMIAFKAIILLMVGWVAHQFV